MSASPESELDKWFPREAEVFQYCQITQPVFQSRALMEGTKSTFTKGMEIIRKEDETTGFQTNVSQIEVFYPWILWKAGLINAPLPEKWISDSADTGTTLGDKLHKADILFNLIVDRVNVFEVSKRLPTYKPRDREPYQAAMIDIDLPLKASQEEIEDALIRAWTVLHSFRGFQEASDTPLFSEGFINPEKKNKVFYGDEVYALGLMLAKTWAREAVSPNPLTWEFEIEAYTQREVATSMNFVGPRLQFFARIDSISRFGRTKRKVNSQAVDLKTGTKIETRGLARDVEIRQAQATRIAAERFVSRYLVGEGSLAPRDEAFFWRGDHRNRASIERLDMVGFRRFDKKTGLMQIEPIEMSEADRQEFDDWLQWYGTMIHAYRKEMEGLRVKIKKAGLHYDLREISISQLNI